ncbi:MAG: transglycosylase SLT domain-containing protein, partial [Muribaculaceae bacterium]|nr:transglycosylase SLT domain-containing protein [Muribaculaceae bacterium]
AAQAYQESKFKPNARSWVGARGLMQIMPATARGYRTPVSKLNNPETSVKVASALINDLDGYLKKYVPNDKERVKFVIAAYNVGIAHVYDAIRLAQKYGLDPAVWDNNVEKAILMKMNPKYYNDPVVRHGYCRGTETVDYVEKITNFYEHARREISA